LAVVASPGRALNRPIGINSTAAARVSGKTEVAGESAPVHRLTNGGPGSRIHASTGTAVGATGAGIAILQAAATASAADLKAVAGSSVIRRAGVAAAVAVPQADVAIRLAAVGANADPSLAVGGAAIGASSACLSDDFTSSRRVRDLGATSGSAGIRATIG